MQITMRMLRYIIGAAVLILISAAACVSSDTGARQYGQEDRTFSGAGVELEDLMRTATPAATATPPSSAALALAQLPPGVVGHYAPAGEEAGALPAGAPYQVIGRYGAGWLLLRLPEHGEFWVPAAALVGIDLSAIPNYAEGDTP
jgi:hypothetical protein